MTNRFAAEAAYTNNAPVALASHAGTLGRANGERAGDVSHICFECGGHYAESHGALIVVQTCPSCGGLGSIPDADLSAAVARFNARVEKGNHDG